MIIGRFSETPDGCFIGHIRTAFFKADKVVFEPVTNPVSDKVPAFRLRTGDEIELGAAWRKTSADGVAYFDVTLDDPTFAHAVRCRLWPAREQAHLILERASRRTTPEKPTGFCEGTRASAILPRTTRRGRAATT